MSQAIPVFVISLARAPERRAAVLRHLAELGIDVELIDAVDGSKLPPGEVASITRPGVSVHPGAIGCYLSHLDAYERIQAKGFRVGLVLEDDARLDQRVVRLLRVGCMETDFDYCFLDCDDHNAGGPIFYDVGSETRLSPDFTAYTLSGGPQTTHAYFITREAATKRLDCAFPITKPIDIYDHLPYPIHFRAIVAPKAAWVSEHSLESFTSTKKTSTESLSLAGLRRWPVFYTIRDLIKLKGFRRNRHIQRLVRSGRLTAGKRWRALPSGREILFD